ncbi:MAG: hypothetical protein M1818_007466 [Claussenomyces sp. TS43310]|nr:MAG: hypothetical protein M1818_007466 [Claussenomyces sp. TS43310]
MNTKFHIFSSATTAATIFGRSREFIFGPVVASMMENGVNLPVADRPMFNVPISDKKHSASFSKEEQQSQEFVETNHSIYLKYLTGKWLDDIITVYMNHFFATLDETLDLDNFGEDCRSLELHDLMRRLVFNTSRVTFFGSRLPTFWKNMWPDFRAFSDATYAGVRSNMAYYLQPRAYLGRERMLKAFDRWVDCEVEDWKEEEGVWNEKWGIRMNWERENLARKYGFTHRGRACSQAGFLFVIIANAAPMATWFIVSIIQSPERLERFRREVYPLLIPQSGLNPNDLRFDMAKLKANPYVHGLWNEALRLGSASAAARVVSKDTELEGYALKRGSVVLLPVQLLHFDEDVFPNPEQFIPERWISELPSSATNEEREAAMQQQRKQAASLRSFGGGTGLCSGRFVAEQEILSTVSTMLLLFDIELEDGPKDFKLSPRSIGIMSPAKETKVKLRKRKNPRSL